MSTIDYPIGSTVWSILQVRSLDGIEEFYKSVLNWDLKRGETSFFIAQDGTTVAELVVDPSLEDSAIGWLCFIGVAELEETVTRALNAGAQMVNPSRSIGTNAQAAEMMDPFGVRFGFALMAPGTYTPQSSSVGHLVLVDPTNHNAKEQIEFHLSLFIDESVDHMDHHINIIRNSDGLALRGAYALDEELREIIPPHWLPWFSVANQAIAVENAEAHGGRINTRDNELSFGLWGVVVDPQGGEFKTLQMTKSAV